MSRIMVVTQPEYGHTLPLIPILEKLRHNGHDIVVMTTRYMSPLLQRKGFEVEHWMDAHRYQQKEMPPSGYSFWYEFTHQLRVSKASAILKRLGISVMRHKPDYFLLDHLFIQSYGIDSTAWPLCGRVTSLSVTLPEWDCPAKKSISPLLYLCPPEFEVPRYLIYDPMVHYVEPSCSQPLDMEPIERGSHKPMVLTSFGTQATQSRFVEKLRAISAVASNRHDLDFIIGLGESQLQAFLRHGFKIPENVMLRTRIPQSSLLESASAFITHGGLSSIKEAVALGIPMIIMPEVFDQPFNAMRAVYHGLSSAIFPNELNAEKIDQCLDAILCRSTSTETIVRFRELFLKANANPTAANLIEDQLSSGRLHWHKMSNEDPRVALPEPKVRGYRPGIDYECYMAFRAWKVICRDVRERKILHEVFVRAHFDANFRQELISDVDRALGDMLGEVPEFLAGISFGEDSTCVDREIKFDPVTKCIRLVSPPWRKILDREKFQAMIVGD